MPQSFGECNLVLTHGDLELLKQLKAAGDIGRNVSELSSRVTLDRLARGGFVVARPIGTEIFAIRGTKATAQFVPISNVSAIGFLRAFQRAKI